MMVIIDALPRFVQGTFLTLVLTLAAISANAQERTYHVHVNGLACPFCVYGLERSLGKLQGVQSVSVSLNTGLIQIVMDDGATLDETEIRETIKDAGFTVELFALAAPISTKTGGHDKP